MRTPIAPIVRRLLRYKKKGSVLDLGTGTGRHAVFLAEKGFRVLAIDRDEDRLAILRKIIREEKLRIQTRRVDIGRFWPRKKFDVILAVMSLHYLPTPAAVARVIKRMKTHTKAGGVHVVSALTDKNAKEKRPHLFGKGELKTYYDGWEVLRYEEKFSAPFRSSKTGKTIRQHRAVIIARRIDPPVALGMTKK